ncbi:hypothetical protein U14_05271 [Candidatus Moduliflexus flocculans]|uniref:Uncharacterized protein n=1 Tax=Candidatus Moduliflexus flocculans TaxID=1499966 RepID=A0A081BRG3_9BACT|nr:hypothetical protein U14_05271 [Candidatus Moduliflexus flocculans]
MIFSNTIGIIYTSPNALLHQAQRAGATQPRRNTTGFSRPPFGIRCKQVVSSHTLSFIAMHTYCSLREKLLDNRMVIIQNLFQLLKRNCDVKPSCLIGTYHFRRKNNRDTVRMDGKVIKKFF